MASPLRPRRRLVVLRALGLGDFLTGLPALRGLRDAHPDHQLVLAAPGWLAPLVQVSGVADEFVDLDCRLRFPPLPPALHGADIAVNLHGRGPHSHRALVAARPRQLIAFRHPRIPESAAGPRWRTEHEVTRWCRLLRAYGVASDPARLDLVVHGNRRFNGVTVIHPGSASPAKRWPAKCWAAVASAEHASGRRVVVTGDASELELAAFVADSAGLPRRAVLAGRTDLLALARIVAAAGRVVSADTGVAHLATALRTPSVVLFGPVSPQRWGPPPDRPEHQVLWAGTRSDVHAAQPGPALLSIRVKDVLAALDRLSAPALAG